MEKIEFQNSQNLKIVGLLDLPDTNLPYPMVVRFHGFGGTKESSEEFPQMLNPLGIATLRIDFQGSGESEGKYEEKTITGFLDDAQSAIDYVYSLPNVDKNKIGVAGHSMGAVVAILQAARNSRIRTVVASSPAVKERKTIANLYDEADFNAAQKRGYVELRKDGSRKRLNYGFFEDADQYDLTKEALKIPYKFLVIGAVKDSIVPFEEIKEFSDKVQNVQLLTLQDSDHNLEEEWPVVEKAIKDWFVSKF